MSVALLVTNALAGLIGGVVGGLVQRFGPAAWFRVVRKVRHLRNRAQRWWREQLIPLYREARFYAWYLPRARYFASFPHATPEELEAQPYPGASRDFATSQRNEPPAAALLYSVPPPWWFRWANYLLPERCREVPCPTQPERIMLRQFALWKRYAYLQQFACSEELNWMHSHQWRRVWAFVLWGGYVERRLGEAARNRRAPAVYTMDHRVAHHIQYPTPGHTSLFVGLWRDDDLKGYFPTFWQVGLTGGLLGLEWERQHSRAWRKPWESHIQKLVKRI